MSVEVLPLDDVDAIIFDFGGVLLPLTYSATIAGLSELLGRDVSAFFTDTRQTDLFDAFETGRILAHEFRDELWNTTAAEIENRDRHKKFEDGFERAWNALLGTIPSHHLELLDQLAERKRLFLLSNTNAVHLEHALSEYRRVHPTRKPWDEHFERAHYSHLMGLRKPDPSIFRAVLAEHDLDPPRTLFLDDNRDNVLAASSVGLLANHHPKNSPLLPRFSGSKKSYGER